MANFERRFKIVIESDGGSQRDLSIGWETMDAARLYMVVFANTKIGDEYVDENGMSWDWWIESYFVAV